jgi:ABC-type uncharacterized transport system substrate-binding protein
MSVTAYENLDTEGKRREKPLTEVNNTDKAAGYSDRVVDVSSRNRTLKKYQAVVTSAMGTTAAIPTLGTVATAAAYATVTIPLTAVVGDVINGTITSASVPGNVPLVVDQAASTGNGAYKLVIEFEYDPS